MIGIEFISIYEPKSSLSIKEIAHNENEDNKEYLKSCGIKSVPYAKPFDSLDLAISASKLIFETYNLKPSDIDLVIYLQPRAPRLLMSSELTHALQCLGLEKVFAFTLTDFGCVNINVAFQLIKQLMSTGQYQRALILSGSTPFSENRLRYPVTVIGDGGAAVTIANTRKHNIIDSKISFNGSYWDLFTVDYRNSLSSEWSETCKNINAYSFKLALESKIKFKHLLDQVLHEHKLTVSDIQYFLMQNINTSAFDFYEEAYNIRFSPVCRKNLKTNGHLGSNDILLNFKSMLEHHAPREGERTIIFNNSPVAAWSITLIEH